MRLDDVVVTPSRGRVLCEVMLDDEATSGGVIVPDTMRRASQRAIVRSVGPDHPDYGPLPLNAGDEVIYNRYAIHELVINGRDHILIDAKDVTAYLPLSS